MLHHYKITSQPFYYLHTSTCLIYTDSHTANNNNNKSLSGGGSDGMSMSSLRVLISDSDEPRFAYNAMTSIEDLIPECLLIITNAIHLQKTFVFIDLSQCVWNTTE